MQKLGWFGHQWLAVRTRGLSVVGLMAAMMVAPALVAAQTAGAAAPWPSQPLTLVIGFSKNSTSEVVASAIAQPLSRRLGKPVQVEMVTGKAGSLAAARVAAATDGHTFGVVVNNALTVAHMMDKSLGYDPEKDLRPVALLSSDPMVLAAVRSQAGKTAADFLQAMRAADRKWTYASQGKGSIGHLGMEWLATRMASYPVHLPQLGGPEAVAALKNGQAQMSILPLTLGMRNDSPEGGLKIVAVTSRERSPRLPDVPTLHESGVKDFEYRVWSAAVVPTRMSAEHASRLERELAAVLADPALVGQLSEAGITVPKDSSGAAAARLSKRETSLLGGIVLIRSIQL